jgi:hypothetical protein
MGPLAALALLLAWMIGWPIVVLVLGLPAPVGVLGWVLGVALGGAIAWRARDPRRRSDPVSRVEARRLARERFEADRRRRAVTDPAVARARREREVEDRVEARVQELVARRPRPAPRAEDGDGDA